ncbi:MAG: HEAT repeat domain-containing protein [Armatimonadetes bacterium]|nr:HEAT repeat domain-containing protein [Armatimonadota bacterium]
MTDTHRQWVEELGVKHRAKAAQRSLMVAGALASTALREGLHHPDPTVRVGCCVILDHHLDTEAIPDLLANLDHPHEKVRAWALHALACDRCKEGTCRPGEDDVIPVAAKMLIEDESRWVRQMAAGLLGPSVLRHPAVLPALQHAHTHDPHPVVRKIASWYIPGGPIYKRLARLVQLQRGPLPCNIPS